MDKTSTDATEDAAEEVEEGSTGTIAEEEFDAERAMATIKAQRKAEAEALAKAKDLEAELAKYREVENEKAEAEKALEVKLVERDEALKAKEHEIANLHVKHSFMAEAATKGIADPALAFLAAKEQGLLGEFDPKTGAVTDHEWDELGERYPSFRPAEESQDRKTGDAGARGKGTTATPADQFNSAFRASLGR